MPNNYSNEPMLEMFLFETSQLTVQLEELILAGEKENSFSESAINEIFRIMHTIKGSSAMMMFHNISTLAHSLEDIFYFLREKKPVKIDNSALSDLVLEGLDFIKVELEKIKNGDELDGNPADILDNLKNYLNALRQSQKDTSLLDTASKNMENQQYYIRQSKPVSSSYRNLFRAVIFFEEGCEMENIRAYTILHHLKEIPGEVHFIPEDIIDNDESIEVIRREGFKILMRCNETYESLQEFFNHTIFLKELELEQLKEETEFSELVKQQRNEETPKTLTAKENPIKMPKLTENVTEPIGKEPLVSSGQQSIISVSVAKLDKLMDLVGEMVIAEAMVIQNPDLQGLELSNFEKAARQLNKITSEMQDMVMSIRMVPLTATFHKMHRIVRDMSRKLKKEVELEIIGEETEVDKNIIEHISDPLMHLVRNSVDHGLESAEERINAGKPRTGTITLEAKNAGSDVVILIRDDGRGLDRAKILHKARAQGLLYKTEDEMTDREVFNLILLPGFSTKETVTEFSGRGVGMDVVTKNVETVGGTLSVDSVAGAGTTTLLKIPLTLAIIDGMNIRVGESCYTVPTVSIKESFRPKERDIIKDPDGNEMIMVRGQCYKILRLHELHRTETNVTDITKGILIMVEQDEKTVGIFADELIGQQQVVVKTLPAYIQGFKKSRGLTGCTLLGDGSISLILDVAGLISM